MFLTPLNYSFPLQLVPVYEWEPVKPDDNAAPPAPPPSCGGGDVSPPPADTSSPELRLVFKGYEWRAVAERTVFPRENWESIFRSEADANDDERNPHRHEQTRRPVVPPPKPSHEVSVGMQPTDLSLNKPEASES